MAIEFRSDIEEANKGMMASFGEVVTEPVVTQEGIGAITEITTPITSDEIIQHGRRQFERDLNPYMMVQRPGEPQLRHVLPEELKS